MLIAGEASGDLLAAELVQALRRETAQNAPGSTADYQPLNAGLEPRFFGAGGPTMAASGVKLAFDMTAHAVTGLSDILPKLLQLRRVFHQLLRLARDRQPDVLICVDFQEFNRLFAHAVRKLARHRQDWFHDWNPRIIRYVSPQVWASREERAYGMADDFDLLLSIIPFEKAWYAKRVPRLPVEFVGHPILDRYGAPHLDSKAPSSTPTILLLPGSRKSELARHLPPMLGALASIRKAVPGVEAVMVLPNQSLVELATQFNLPAELQVRAGGLTEALAAATIAIASTGTVMVECAYFGLPTVAMYKTSWATFQVGKRIAKVRYMAMPNLLANEEVFPEFIQNAATPENLARAALELLQSEARQKQIKLRLAQIVPLLGTPGAATRAARAILNLAF